MMAEINYAKVVANLAKKMSESFRVVDIVANGVELTTKNGYLFYLEVNKVHNTLILESEIYMYSGFVKTTHNICDLFKYTLEIKDESPIINIIASILQYLRSLEVVYKILYKAF